MNYYLFLWLLLCLLISYSDINNRAIDNKVISLLVLVQFLFFSIVGGCHIETALTVLVLGMLTYSFGLLGAGDIKYAAVLSLSLPMDLLPSALLLTMLTGGVLASFYLMINLARRIKAKMCGGVDKAQYNTGIPYGVAISVGFYLMIFSHYL